MSSYNPIHNPVDDVERRQSADTLPSKPIIRGCSQERASELMNNFHTRMKERKVARFWLESETDFDQFIVNCARNFRGTK